MKPKQLKYPYLEGEKRIFIHDGILHVPDFFVDLKSFNFPAWKEIFGNDNPVFVEYCSGNGAWIAEKAAASPHLNFVAVEKNFKRVRKIWSKKQNNQLDNLFIVDGEAFAVTDHYFPGESVAGVFINFPDPWPKKKHAKNRLIRDDFIRLLGKVMQEGAELIFVTDDPDYSEIALDVLVHHLIPLDPEPHFITALDNYGTSYFETLWRDKGKTIRYHRFKRACDVHEPAVTVERGASLPR